MGVQLFVLVYYFLKACVVQSWNAWEEYVLCGCFYFLYSTTKFLFIVNIIFGLQEY
jgi:hypothetical protein